MNVIRNKISYNDAFDIIVNRDKTADPPFERAEILVALYFPVLVGQFQQLLSLRDEAAMVINFHKQEYNMVGSHETPALDKMKVFCASLTRMKPDLGSELSGSRECLGCTVATLPNPGYY